MAQVTEEQLGKAREIRSKQQQIQMELGGLYVSQEDLKARQNQLVEELRKSGEEIQTLMNELAQEHGHGTLNLETGEFTASEQETE
jgi:uncharacterized protein YoxC